jgi:hypothetical protein
MPKKSADDVIDHIHGKYQARIRKANWRWANECGKPGEAMPNYHTNKGHEVSEAQADKAYQNAHPERITLPKLKWMDKP